MAKKIPTLLRRLYLIKIIRNESRKGKRISLKGILDELEKCFHLENYYGENIGLSESTISKDMSTIRKEYGIEIECNKRENSYYIEEQDFSESVIENAIESFEILSSLKYQSIMPDCIIPEKRKVSGIEHFHILLTNILNKKKITFDYKKFDNENSYQCTVSPIALKESENRWYLIAMPDRNDNQKVLRAYGLDRISMPASTSQKIAKGIFTINEIKRLYHDCFAMYNTDTEAEDVILSFDKRDGQYVETFKIHHSQKEEYKGNKVIVTLKIKITEDFIMELMSRAWSIEVIKPKSLRQKLKGYFSDAAKRNA